MKYFLSTDQFSPFKRTVHGHAGDEVTIISERGEIMIVEGPAKNRYPVSKEQLTSIIPNVRTNPPAESNPPAPIPDSPKTTIPTLKENKKKMQGQSSMF